MYAKPFDLKSSLTFDFPEPIGPDTIIIFIIYFKNKVNIIPNIIIINKVNNRGGLFIFILLLNFINFYG